MAQRNKLIWTNLAVGILGIFVGLDNLLRWFDDGSHTRNLIIGLICMICATGWIIYILFVKKPEHQKVIED
jgi:hypothetical protein